jgi:hypothetical protein
MIIGITGKAQSGKDTACRIVQLINTVDYDCACSEGEGEKYILDNVDNILPMTCMWEKHAFADKLKECASIILGVPRFMFESGEFKESFTSLPLSNKEGEPMTYREFLQYFGTEVGRNIDKDLWVKALMYSYGRDKENHWIIPDVRFPNEADAIRNAGGVLWKIERDGSGAGNHISEKLIDDINVDLVIENNLDMKYYIKAIIMAYNHTMELFKR